MNQSQEQVIAAVRAQAQLWLKNAGKGFVNASVAHTPKFNPVDGSLEFSGSAFAAEYEQDQPWVHDFMGRIGAVPT